MRRALLFSAMAILLLGSGAASQNPARPAPDAGEGKKVFAAAGCAKCHDADASKKLPDGTTLLARLAKNKDPEARLATRLKNEQERHQVFLYLQPLIEHERLTEIRQGSVASGPK
jgi:mono/diheme cytochrome c family protein